MILIIITQFDISNKLYLIIITFQTTCIKRFMYLSLIQCTTNLQDFLNICINQRDFLNRIVFMIQFIFRFHNFTKTTRCQVFFR